MFDVLGGGSVLDVGHPDLEMAGDLANNAGAVVEVSEQDEDGVDCKNVGLSVKVLAERGGRDHHDHVRDE